MRNCKREDLAMAMISAKREMIPHMDFMSRLKGMFNALDYSAAKENRHDEMYEVICRGWELGGIKTCEMLEAKAVSKHGFDRSKISWYKPMMAELIAKMSRIGNKGDTVAVASGIVEHRRREKKAELEHEIEARRDEENLNAVPSEACQTVDDTGNAYVSDDLPF